MACRSAVLQLLGLGKKATNKITRLKSLIIHETSICQPVGIHEMNICGQCARASVLSGWTCAVIKKRKLLTVAVGVGQARESCNYGGHTALINSSRFQALSMPQEHNLCGSSHVKDSDITSSFCVCLSRTPWYSHSDSGGLLKINSKSSLFDACSSSTFGALTSPKLLLQHQNVHHFSRRRRHTDRDRHDSDDEEKKRRLRGAVMYVANPVTWISKQWNILKLKHKLDPAFSENEFLFGAKQAITHVSQMVSNGKFDQLSGLVIEEVIDWLMSFRNSLASREREALALAADDVVLMKIRYVHLDPDQDKAVAYVDSVCFGLRVCDRAPYFVDLGIRFKRDYSTDPPGDWVVAGVSHIRLQNLSTH